MTSTKLLIRPVFAVFAIAIPDLWATTQRTAALLTSQAKLGGPRLTRGERKGYQLWTLSA